MPTHEIAVPVDIEDLFFSVHSVNVDFHLACEDQVHVIGGIPGPKDQFPCLNVGQNHFTQHLIYVCRIHVVEKGQLLQGLHYFLFFLLRGYFLFPQEPGSFLPFLLGLTPVLAQRFGKELVGIDLKFLCLVLIHRLHPF